MGTLHAVHKNKGHRGTTSLRPNYYWSTKEPHTPNIVVESYRKMGGIVTHTHVTNKSQRPRTTKTSRRHPGNKLTSPTIEVNSRCNRLGLRLLRSGSLGKSNGTFTADELTSAGPTFYSKFFCAHACHHRAPWSLFRMGTKSPLLVAAPAFVSLSSSLAPGVTRWRFVCFH